MKSAPISAEAEGKIRHVYPSGAILNSLKFIVPSRNMHFFTNQRILQNLQGKLPHLL